MINPIEKYIQSKKITLREAGKQLGVDHAQLHRYMTGKALPTLPTIIKLAEKTNNKISIVQWVNYAKSKN